MSDIPTDVFQQILRRVPVDTLFKLRSVCKSWRRIIDHPKFAQLHLTHGTGDQWILHRNEHGKLFLLPLRQLVYHKPNGLFGDDPEWPEWMPQSKCFCDKSRMEVCPECFCEFVSATHVKVLVCPGVPRIRNLPVPSCNGLILVSSNKPHLDWVIWNPFTGESLRLPSCNECLSDWRKGYNDYPCSGIGYDEARDDYKVVKIVQSCTFIYSVNSKTWRRIQDFPAQFIPPYTEDGAFVNGALHWFSPRWSWIVGLDLTMETYRTISLPLQIIATRNPCSYKLVALSGFLFLTCWNFNQQFDLWMLKDYNGCDDTMWTKMMSLEMWGEFISGQHSPAAYLKNENLILLQRSREEFWWYDVEKQLLKEVSLNVEDRNGDYGVFSSQIIPASLVRLHRSDAANEEPIRKRKRGVSDMLDLKVLFGDPMNW